MRRLERKEEPAADLERVEPGAQRMRRGGVDVNGVGLGQVLDARAGADLDLGVAGEVGSRPLGDVGLDLVGDDPARSADEMSEDRGVIAGAGADLDDRLALLHAERVDRLRVQRRLAVVDAAAARRSR